MRKESKSKQTRNSKDESLESDLVIVGGGLAGTCAAISAARADIKVTLIQDRPVLGGNASSEIRLWALGATSHMGNNNRWAREGGIVDEILVENLYRNKEGNPVVFDTILLEKVVQEPNIQLLLNTAVYKVEKAGADRISKVLAFCSQNSTHYELKAPLFCDASGDGIVAFQAGAAFRMGAETKDEFGEGFAPNEDYGELLGHSIYFYTKDFGAPVKYHAPDYALKDITKLPRFKGLRVQDTGCNYWWIEFGGRKDTIHETEEIKWELWKIVYGIWDYIKNSGKFPEAETKTLEWVGNIPGKRESRRFEGDYMLNQEDIVMQRPHPDTVASGGWSLDLHPADGVYSDRSPCTQWHSKGVYGIPYRCYYSRDISNLFLAGRIISASHVAFGSTRVMLTCAHGGTAVGKAAAQCRREGLLPRDLLEPCQMRKLQQTLNREGQAIPRIPLEEENNPVASAAIQVSSTLRLFGLKKDGPWLDLEFPAAQLLPLTPADQPEVSLLVRAKKSSELRVALRVSEKTGNFTPENTLCEKTYMLGEGEQEIVFNISVAVPHSQYAFLTIYGSEGVEIACSNQRITGLLSTQRKFNHAVSNRGEQIPPEGIGVDRFEFWVPQRRPEGHNIAFSLSQPLRCYEAENLKTGIFRPTTRPNAWVADFEDENPTIHLNWKKKQSVRTIYMYFDTDYDHPMETVQWGHPESVMPYCIRNYVVRDAKGTILHRCECNHQTINRIQLEATIETDQLTIEMSQPSETTPASVFGIRIY